MRIKSRARFRKTYKCFFLLTSTVPAQSAVLGFGVFRILEQYGITTGLSIGENVILQTTSVATATMPLAAGKPSDVCQALREQLMLLRPSRLMDA